MAASALDLSVTALAPRITPSVVTRNSQVESTMRSASESGEKPPNTIEWTAPIRAQASIAMASSLSIGM